MLAYPASATITWYNNGIDCTPVPSYTAPTGTSIQLYAGTDLKNMDHHTDWYWHDPEGGEYHDDNKAVEPTTPCGSAVAECQSVAHELTIQGTWTVDVYFYKNAAEAGGSDTGSIDVIATVPEFPFGPAIVIIIPGFIYFVMRKRIKIDRLNHGKN